MLNAMSIEFAISGLARAAAPAPATYYYRLEVGTS